MAPLEDERKLVFLVAFQEPLWTMLAVLDFWTSPIDQVIDRVLEMDSAQTRNYMAMDVCLSWGVESDN